MKNNYTLTTQERENRKVRAVQMNADLSEEKKRERALKAASTREAKRIADKKRLEELEKFLASMRTTQTP